jgi:hypothetical protein
MLGEDPVATSVGIMLYPNPAIGGFNLLLKQPAVQDFSIELVSVNGEVKDMLVLEKGKDRIYIPFRGPSGMYLLKIRELQITIPVVITN